MKLSPIWKIDSLIDTFKILKTAKIIKKRHAETCLDVKKQGVGQCSLLFCFLYSYGVMPNCFLKVF